MSAEVSRFVVDRLPELEPFAHAVRERAPHAGTWCEAWTVRDIVIHQAGNADELARVIGAHLAGEPVATRSFEPREAPYRAISDDAELWAAFHSQCARLGEVSQRAEWELARDTEIAWTGRIVSPSFFAEHMREELVLHRWDMTGDDDTARQALTERWMTEHSVTEVGKPLLARGAAGLDLDTEGSVYGRLRAPGTDDIVVAATAEGNSIEFAAPEGEATIESDAAVRALLLWGRRPADPARWHSQAGPAHLRRLRDLLSGY